ncbi:hypothetical protein SAMN05421866_0049 [Chryseobacterium oranimense]|uniref:Uncharacterized protein n=1 Tax=Chryseobacterium oranimense TaxID=421058 RepID=A0A1M5X9Y7_9FLAO|nr:hypothetical protein [Chryseobacterium oranimense]SHH96033.1 hypothetical protein SAMN05421866_0049 [Chryseobacterium oranimense]
MIVVKEFPNKQFSSKSELFKALKEHKDIIVSAKKAEIYKSCEKGLSVVTNQMLISKFSEASKSFEIDDDYYYFVVNSSNILDSHSDLHIPGNWDKTVKEQQGKVYLVWDHTLIRTEIIAMKNDVEMLTAEIPFKSIGKNYEGSTYCLIYKVRKDKIVNEDAKKWLNEGFEFEASVRMQYVDIDLAIDSNDEDYEKEKTIFDTYYPQIANKSDYEDIFYFWVVKQAKNVLESSLVMFGSNPATGRIQENEEPVKSTLINIEPADATHGEQNKNINDLFLI